MRVILVHGFNASPERIFIRWLAAQLRERGFEVVTPKLSLTTKEELNLPLVIEEMKSAVGYIHADDILLGHSLGAFIVLQYLSD